MNELPLQTQAGAVVHRHPDVLLRPLVPEDLAAVTLLDRTTMGVSRHGYFERRLQSALRHPRRHYQLALTAGKGLVGFLLARRAGGEFGRPQEVVVLESIGIEASKRHAGLGRQLVRGLEQLMHEHHVTTLVTEVDWRNHAMMKFLDGAGFVLAPRPIVERLVDRMPLPNDDDEIEKWPPVVRHLRGDDFAAIARIDQAITGKDRSAYLERKFDEVLNESAIEVSLVAENDGFAVAFAMARVDFGDFGHVEPSAELDTIGVDPAFAKQGFGRAVLSQLIENLAALHVEVLQTEASRDSLGLLKFLYDFGFRQSQRLCFQRSGRAAKTYFSSSIDRVM